MAESYTIPNIDELSDGCMKSISSLSITSRNLHLPEQCVSVEYLPDHQKLKISAALGMSWSPTIPSLCQTHPTLYSRFWKVASMSYTEIKSLVKNINTTTARKIREVVDGLEMITPSSERPTWETTEADSDETFCKLSKVLQFNCESVTLEILPYTLRMIAALNLHSVGGYPLGAWVRAYALGIGIYPSLGSAFKTEAVCTTKLPSTYDEADVLAFQQSYKEVIENLCLNILAVFGLLHLSKDKTYVNGDAYMSRICNSYLETLKTPDTASMMLTNHKECLLRIAPHPFGIAQTYWLAKVMYKHQLIMPSLVTRYNLPTPPPVQRIIVINEAVREWENLPEAREVLEMFSDNLSRLKTQELAIKEAPPRYSDLYRFYGCEEKITMPDKVLADVKTLMPATYGFAMVAHVSKDGKKKDGIALARCLKSVERDTNQELKINVWLLESRLVEKKMARSLKKSVKLSLKHVKIRSTTSTFKPRSRSIERDQRIEFLGGDNVVVDGDSSSEYEEFEEEVVEEEEEQQQQDDGKSVVSGGNKAKREVEIEEIQEETVEAADEEITEAGNRVMVVVDKVVASTGALEWALKHTLQSHDYLFLLYFSKPFRKGKKKNRKREVKTDELVHTLKKLCQTKRPGIEVEIRRLEGKEKERGEKIVEEAKEQQVTLLVVGEEKKPPVWRVVKRWGWKKRRGRAGVLKYCLEKASCMTIAVKPKNRKLGGYLITTKRHKNFWLLA
ncbi:unnamed protein product [Eruca vesicaria subsp. sativa]|uniref:UspA domain-containing protein n=1 Tax=Eruca vesicaria subsp. sativa TaxID=29727 RepID=A0ABC8LT36_ERUVS|nr:unnamed protein product [Eruca vesicaria subsp. sativa]